MKEKDKEMLRKAKLRGLKMAVESTRKGPPTSLTYNWSKEVELPTKRQRRAY